jgi:hypothetical protein
LSNVTRQDNDAALFDAHDAKLLPEDDVIKPFFFVIEFRQSKAIKPEFQMSLPFLGKPVCLELSPGAS